MESNKEKNGHLVVAFDCDETLWDNQYQRPRKHIVSLFRIIKKLGCHTIIWSAAGSDWAREVCEKCNIHPDEIRAKPPYDDWLAGKKFVDLDFDDCESFGKITIYV